MTFLLLSIFVCCFLIVCICLGKLFVALQRYRYRREIQRHADLRRSSRLSYVGKYRSRHPMATYRDLGEKE